MGANDNVQVLQGPQQHQSYQDRHLLKIQQNAVVGNQNQIEHSRNQRHHRQVIAKAQCIESDAQV